MIARGNVLGFASTRSPKRDELTKSRAKGGLMREGSRPRARLDSFGRCCVGGFSFIGEIRLPRRVCQKCGKFLWKGGWVGRNLYGLARRFERSNCEKQSYRECCIDRFVSS